MKSKSKIKAGRYNLVVVAHPDDEVIFFGATILQSKLPVHIVCATDGNADGLGIQRMVEFTKSCKKLGANSSDQIGLPDIFEKRLDRSKISDFLKTLPVPNAVFTHGPIGEYGHPHHQDVSRSVHETFVKHKNIWGLAVNANPDKSIIVRDSDFKVKSKIYTEIYFNETKRFISTVPVAQIETFCKFKLEEVTAIHDFLSSADAEINVTALKKYSWFQPYFNDFRTTTQHRRF